MAMMILVAGPYRSGTNDDPDQIKANIDAMMEVALVLFLRGHLPVLAEWFALPLIAHAGSKAVGDGLYNDIFHPVAGRLLPFCSGCLRVGGPSAGADNMVESARGYGQPVYYSIDEIPGY